MFRAFLIAAIALAWATPSASADCVCAEPGLEQPRDDDAQRHDTRISEAPLSSLVLWSDVRNSDSPRLQFYTEHYSQSVEGAASVGGVPLSLSQPIRWSSFDVLMSRQILSVPERIHALVPLMEWSAEPLARTSGDIPASGGFVLVCTGDSSLCVPLPPVPMVKDTVATGAGAGAVQTSSATYESGSPEPTGQSTHSRSIDSMGPSGVISRLFRPPARIR